MLFRRGGGKYPRVLRGRRAISVGWFGVEGKRMTQRMCVHSWSSPSSFGLIGEDEEPFRLSSSSHGSKPDCLDVLAIAGESSYVGVGANRSKGW